MNAEEVKTRFAEIEAQTKELEETLEEGEINDLILIACNAAAKQVTVLEFMGVDMQKISGFKQG